jgi:hypothetical protein
MSQINTMDDLFAAGMDDIADLPPVGVPPSGHYNLLVTAQRKQSDKEGGGEYVLVNFKVTAINEVKNPEEADQAAIGLQFSNMTSPVTKEGKYNEYGMGILKELVAPFAAHFGSANFGEALVAMDKVECCATLKRTQDKKDRERFNFRLSDITVL